MEPSCVFSGIRENHDRIDTKNRETDKIDLRAAKNVPELVGIIIDSVGRQICIAQRLQFIIDNSINELTNSLISDVTKRLNEQPNIVTTTLQTNLIVVCDIHGEEWNLQAVLFRNGLPSEHNKYIFNGDIVDRGPASLECILIILALKHKYHDFVFINRGNHETMQVNNADGFHHEVRERLDVKVYNIFSECFRSLPLGTIVECNKIRIITLHGGIPVDDREEPLTIDKLQNIRRQVEPKCDSSEVTQVLWGDACKEQGIHKSDRNGWGRKFGPDVTAKFLKMNDLHGVVRGHQDIQGSFSIIHPNSLTYNSSALYRVRCLQICPGPTFTLWTLHPSPECHEYEDHWRRLGHGRCNPDIPEC